MVPNKTETTMVGYWKQSPHNCPTCGQKTQIRVDGSAEKCNGCRWINFFVDVEVELKPRKGSD